MTCTPELQATDVLADVLHGLLLRSEVYYRTVLAADTGLALPPGQAHFHVVTRGTCHVLAGATATLLRAGDLALLPGGQGHVLSAAAAPGAVLSLDDAAARGLDHAARVLRVGAGAAAAEVICGRFLMDPAASQALLLLLPPLIAVVGRDGEPPEHIGLLLRLLASEVPGQALGAPFAAARLFELLFVEALRRWLEEEPAAVGGWLGALRDPQIGAAIHLLHARPAHDWSLSELARAVGMSRTPFVARFTALVGEPPRRYLMRWRVQVATRLLRGGASVREAAEQVGYRSEEAFSRTFKRITGQPPVRLRGR